MRARHDPPATAIDCMTADARVERVHADRTVELSVVEPPRCKGCEGTCIWRVSPASSLRVRSNGQLQPGQLVTISLKRKDFLRGALLLHGLPWAGLVGGAALGALLRGGDLWVLVGAMIGLAGGLLAMRAIVARGLGRPRWLTPDLIVVRES